MWGERRGEKSIRRVLREGKFRRGDSKICSQGKHTKVRSKIWVGGAKFGGWAGNNAGRPMDDGWLKQIDYL